MNPVVHIRALFEPLLVQLLDDRAKIADYLGLIRPAQNADHGDYQANFAMPLAKELKRKPPEVAAEIVARLPDNEVIETPQVAGPGFINLRFKNRWLANQVRGLAGDDRLGIATATTPRQYVIDYSSPNVAKPLHVGHLRSTIIGDALTRLLRFLGHTVITDNHLGDWGTQFGMLIHGYRHYVDAGAYEKNPLRELARIYKVVRDIIKEEEKGLQIAEHVFSSEDMKGARAPTEEQCQRETARLHAGDPDNLALWRQFMPACLAGLHETYRRLGTLPFDHEHGESFYNDMLSGVVADMLAKGIAFESAGAIVIPNAKGIVPPPETDKKKQKDEPAAIIRKRDGAFLYTTSDLATIKFRIDNYSPDGMLYVVDARQALHFRTFFAQARRWGYTAVQLEHISFGSVLGTDGKPLKTREGAPDELLPLLDDAIELARKSYQASFEMRKELGHDVESLTDAAVQDIAEAIGAGAVKYADLSQNRNSDYKYDPEKMLAMDGNTAAYMQYAYARCRAIFRKGQIDETRFRAALPELRLDHPLERALGLHLLRFEETLTLAAAEFMPHYITAYLWDLARAFSGFFENCPVLAAESAQQRDGRLLLVDLTGRTIKQALALLGIRTVERM